MGRLATRPTPRTDLLNQLPLAARVYVASVILVGGSLFALYLPYARFDHPGVFVGLLLLAIAASTFKVYLPLPGGGSTMSISYAVDFASLLLIGPEKTMIVAVTSAVCQCTMNTRVPAPWYKTAFSMASVVITVRAAALTFQVLGGDMAHDLADWSIVGALVGTATTYFLVNTGLVATAIALSTREHVPTVWHNNFLWSAPSYFISVAAASFGATLVLHAGYWLVPLAVVPLYLAYHTYKVYMGRIEDEQKQVKQTAELHLATVEALARAIDAKDQLSYTHVWRVQLYAARLAEALGLAEAEIQGIKTAALLHDIGKLAVPEHILWKPGPLTKEEFEKVRIHPQVGAEIIAGVPFPYPVAAVMLSHHERWDGTGYPRQLKGEDIPLGARILSIVDYFDAVTSERPYHRALGHDKATELIRSEAGRALDPSLVPVFIGLLPSLLEESAAEEHKVPHAASLGRAPIGANAPGAGSEAHDNVFANIAQAHREIYALYEIAQSMSISLSVADTMALISSNLTKIVPWSGCSLFLYDRTLDSLKCAYAVGLDAPQLLERTVAGDSLADWVARHKRMLVSSDPRQTFEAAGLEGRTELRSAMVCPLYFDDTFVGVFSVYHAESDRYTDDHRRLFERVAEQAGTVLHNSIVFEQTQEDAQTDQLTGLPNRRWLTKYLPQELTRAERPLSEVAVIVIDIDDFKSINDSHGHDVGDRALQAVAKGLLSVCRSYDMCARYAGDEFIVVLPNCSREDAEQRRLELQARLAEIEVTAWPETTLRLGASAGVAVYPADGATSEALISAADQRMYRDKAANRAGRGRVHAEVAMVSLAAGGAQYVELAS